MKWRQQKLFGGREDRWLKGGGGGGWGEHAVHLSVGVICGAQSRLSCHTNIVEVANDQQEDNVRALAGGTGTISH